MALGNAQASEKRFSGDGKCNREYTADGRETQARVKKCGKSALERLVTALLVNPAGARPNRGDETARFATTPGRSLEVRGNSDPR